MPGASCWHLGPAQGAGSSLESHTYRLGTSMLEGLPFKSSREAHSFSRCTHRQGFREWLPGKGLPFHGTEALERSPTGSTCCSFRKWGDGRGCVCVCVSRTLVPQKERLSHTSHHPPFTRPVSTCRRLAKEPQQKQRFEHLLLFVNTPKKLFSISHT